jgi:hypothetical protein
VCAQMCDKVSVYGVGDGMAGSWHYFESRDFATSREFGVDPHHSFELEHDMLQIMHAAGVIEHHRTDHANATFALKAATAAQVNRARCRMRTMASAECGVQSGDCGVTATLSFTDRRPQPVVRHPLDGKVMRR